MVSCASIGCSNSSENSHKKITFHRFPKNPQMRNLWLLAMRRQNWIPTKHSVLCSAHFTERSFSRNLKSAVLKKKAVPSIFPSSYLQSMTHALQKEEQSRNLEIENAIIFMTQVKNTFHDEPEVYQNFVRMLSEYRAQRIHYLRKAKLDICKLFKGHPELIVRINSLLPNEWRVETQPHDHVEDGNAIKAETVQKDLQPKKLEMEKVLSFMDEVKNTFSDKPEVYQNFLRILDGYKSQSFDCMRAVHQDVLTLFRGHQELLVQIKYYLHCEFKIKMESNEQMQAQDSVEPVTTQIKEEEFELENTSSSSSSYTNQLCVTQIKKEHQESELENSSSAHVSHNEFEVYQVFTDLLKELKKQREVHDLPSYAEFQDRKKRKRKRKRKGKKEKTHSKSL